MHGGGGGGGGGGGDASRARFRDTLFRPHPPPPLRVASSPLTRLMTYISVLARIGEDTDAEAVERVVGQLRRWQRKICPGQGSFLGWGVKTLRPTLQRH